MADYGEPNDVGSLVPRWVNTSGHFDATTRPTLGQVQGWVNEVSEMLNVILSAYGFTIPVTHSRALLMLNMFVNQEVAAICEGVNGSGRFGPTGKQVGKAGRFALMTKDVQEFIDAISIGLEQMGVPRTYSLASNIGYRGTDEDGNDIAPLFQRSDFGNQVISG